MNRFLLALTFIVLRVIQAGACDLTRDPTPTWEEFVVTSDIVFVGRVVRISPETPEGFGRALFEVESWIKGGEGDTFLSAQGSGSNCVIEFAVGDHVIFVGDVLANNDGNNLAIAEDAGFGQTVFLSDPPTPEQAEQLARLESYR